MSADCKFNVYDPVAVLKRAAIYSQITKDVGQIALRYVKGELSAEESMIEILAVLAVSAERLKEV